jgi:membrane protease YdiL (CAAX protease family)
MLFEDIKSPWLLTTRIKLKTLLAAFLSVTVVEIVGAAILRVYIIPSLAMLACIRVIDIVVLFIIVIRYQVDPSNIGLDPDRIPSGIRKGVLWSLAVGFVTGIFALLLYSFGINPLQLIKAPLPKAISDIVLYFIVGGIISPTAEEFFFRGLLFLYFRRWGFLPALILSTTVFAFLHPLASGIPLPQIVGGLLFAIAFEIEKNLLVPIVIHITGNLAIFTLSLLTI